MGFQCSGKCLSDKKYKRLPCSKCDEGKTPIQLRQKPVELTASPAKAHLVFYQLRDNDEQILAMLVARYNGQLEDAVAKAEKLDDLMRKNYPVQARHSALIGAFDADGAERWIIAPNFKQVFTANTKDAFLAKGESYETAAC